jgi:heme exporter protein B
LPGKSAGSLSEAFAVYQKDLRLELRSKYAVNAIFMFAVTTLAMVSFSVGQSNLAPNLLAALYWIVLFFSAMAGLAQVFVREEESGTALALRLSAHPTAVFLGKLLFNFTLLVFLTVLITPMFFIFTDATAGNPYLLALVVALGVVGLCGSTTLVAAIIARTAVRGALFAVLSFPILVFLLLLLVSASTRVFAGDGFGGILPELQGLLAYDVVMITASFMLFRFVWQE